MENKNRPELTKLKYLLDPEFEHLERILHKFKDRNSRDCALLWTAMYTGARAQEILNIRVEDLCEHEHSVYIRGLKDSFNREMPLPDWLYKMLKAQQTTGFVFPITYNRFRQIWQEYRPTNKKLHCLRHTFAIRLYRKTKDIRIVQTALGHRYFSSTMIYMTYQYSNSELRKAILG